MERTYNERMHPLNKYSNRRPDYLKLARKYDFFDKYVKGRSLDYTSEEACKALAKVLLYEDFNIRYWKLPAGYLVPTIPQRLNYICWLKELLDSDEQITVLDIGTGASLVYPLLGVSQYNWKFVATDIDENALENCKKIIRKNELQDNITVITVIEGDILKSIDVKFNISMCNPPFYDSLDKFAPKIHKVSEENTVIRGYAGTHNEMKTPGGELRFIQQYISESVLKRNEVTWFTCLIGIKSHIKTLQHYLKHQFSDIEIKKTTFYQGKTLRWGLAWRFIEN